MQTYWEHFQHGADIGVRGVGDTLSQAFEQAALALTSVVTDAENIATSHSVHVECDAPDLELLLVDWLNAVIYEMATRRMLFARYDVKIDGTRLLATAWGDEVDIDRHRPVVEVKGATYTELRVCQQADGRWLAQCVVDV